MVIEKNRFALAASAPIPIIAIPQVGQGTARHQILATQFGLNRELKRSGHN